MHITGAGSSSRTLRITGLPKLTPKQHILACALEIERQHGDRALVFVAERIGALALEGDVAGVTMWQAIAAAMAAHLDKSKAN